MVRRVRDLLQERARETFVGRRRELATLSESLTPGGPVLYYVHGIPGVGKSTLLARFAQDARTRGAEVLSLDCRLMEPTPAGFFREVGKELECPISALHELTGAIERTGGPVILLLDGYEVFCLMDTWLRQSLTPSLPEATRLVLASREPPASPWLTRPEWQGLFREMQLNTLSEEESRLLLSKAGVDRRDLQHVTDLAHGHPLALRMAAALTVSKPGPGRSGLGLESIVREMTDLFLNDIDPEVRNWLMAVSIVRRVTETLLAAVCPDVDSAEAYRHLSQIPFIHAARDGLRIHEAVRDSIARSLRASNPQRHREYRARAWHQLRAESQEADPGELWRYTADMLYLIENPVIREAFFPSGSRKLSVEPAGPEDWPEIEALAAAHDGRPGARPLHYWRRKRPDSFHVVRERDGRAVGFYCMFKSTAARECTPGDDPVAAEWQAHLERNPTAAGETVLFLRRWLAREAGENPSPEQAACWLDIKRAYMEMRPKLRRVYITVRDLVPHASVATQLGFRHLSECTVEIEGAAYHTAMLDFGPGSVDGWLGRLAAAELGIESHILDRKGRALMAGGRRVSLTPLEYQVMAYLCDVEGRVVSRTELLERVWGHSYLGGSNVVDAVVKSLRKKMGTARRRIETVRGFGYRYLPE